MKITIYIKYLFLIFTAVVVVSCPQLNHSSTTPCSGYQYSEKQQSWVDYSGRPVYCTIADGKRIFDWIPPKGCQHWVDVFAIDASAKVSEIVIEYGGIGHKYCVLQRYISLGDSGQVLLIDNAYCLRQTGQQGQSYSFSSCEGVSASDNQNTPSNTSDRTDGSSVDSNSRE